MKRFWMWMRTKKASWFGTRATICKHKSKLKFSGKVGEKEFSGDMNLHPTGLPYCADCFMKMAVPCAYCGLPICIGDPITLYAKMPDFEVHKGAVCFDGNVYVGCLRWDCAMSGLDRSGFWMPDPDADEVMGCVKVVPSPLEMLLNSPLGMLIIDPTKIPPEALPPELRPPQRDKGDSDEPDCRNGD